MDLSTNIKHLRLRMGWTQADLARHLHCQTTIVESWESGALAPDAVVRGELELLNRHADHNAIVMHSLPLIESALDKSSLTQIMNEDFDHEYDFRSKEEIDRDN